MVYDYKCEKCEEVFEDVRMGIKDLTSEEINNGVCPICGSEAKRIFTIGTLGISVFHPYLDTNMDSEPIYVESREHKKQLLKERDLVQI